MRAACTAFRMNLEARTAGTYFVQAREYQTKNGRFTAEDVIKGNGVFPETLNRYGYCWGNPVGLVDKDGLYPTTQEEWAGNQE